MSLSTILYRFSYLPIAPGLVALAISFVGVQMHSTSDLVRWCTLWWWITLVAGFMPFCLIRVVAWFIRR